MDRSYRPPREMKNVKLSRSKTIAFDRAIAEKSTPGMPTVLTNSGRVYQPNRKGRDMFEEGEYVETRAVTSVKIGTSKTMASALKRRSGMQSMTVRLPKNPFLDEDYADMTGHQNSPVKMDMLRRTMRSPPKGRSHSESSTPMETEFGGARGVDSIDGISPLRDVVSPARTRSITTASRTSSIKSNFTSSAAEDDMDVRTMGKDKYLPRSSQSFSGSLISNGEFKKSTVPTVTEEIPQVAVVVEETSPAVNSYQTFSKGVQLTEKLQKSGERRIFSKTSKCKTIIAILAIIFLVALLVAIGILAYIVTEKDKEIERLNNYINMQQNSISTTPVEDSPTSPPGDADALSSAAMTSVSFSSTSDPSISSSTSTTAPTMTTSMVGTMSLSVSEADSRITTVEGSATTETST